MTIQEAVDKILAGRIVEFSCHGAACHIQEENNKGYNYLSIWRVAPSYGCLDRVFFDIDDAAPVFGAPGLSAAGAIE